MAIFDDVCEFDENQICKRHKVKHEGKSLEWSQDRDLLGWKSRKAWDKLVGAPAAEAPKKDCGCNKPKGNLR